MILKGKRFENCRLGMEIYVYEVEGKEMFIGKEIADMLGYSNPSTAISENVKQSQRKKFYINTIENVGYSEIPKNANINMITEIGLYQLVMRSSLPSSEEFQQWVYEEVLPSMRKNNYYVDKYNITTNQLGELKDELLLDFCAISKISLGRASEQLFGNKVELRKRLVGLGLLNYEECKFVQKKFKDSIGKEHDFFVVN
ncbi:MAG: BRO-N domain-containing protein, partial [Fusobacteriaceae bacterium]